MEDAGMTITSAQGQTCPLAYLRDERDSLTRSLETITDDLRPVVVRRLRQVSERVDRLERSIWESYIEAKYPIETLSDIIG